MANVALSWVNIGLMQTQQETGKTYLTLTSLVREPMLGFIAELLEDFNSR